GRGEMPFAGGLAEAHVFVGSNSFGQWRSRAARANEFAPTILRANEFAPTRNMDNVRMWTQGVPVEEAAYRQIRNIASLPILGGHVAIMPDVHVGKGATVGAVIPTRGAIIPAAVGVDIGCGMVAVRTTLKASDLPDSLAAIRAQIERDVPVGFNAHRSPLRPQGPGAAGDALQFRIDGLVERYQGLRIMDRVGKYDPARVWRQLGTLGGGNHFIE